MAEGEIAGAKIISKARIENEFLGGGFLKK